MAIILLLLVSTLALCLLPLSSSSTTTSSTKLSKDSYLTVGDFLLSTPKGVFEAGFFRIGENAYCFGIRYTKQYDPSTTIVWMVNRDRPVNKRYTKLSLTKSGNLVLTDAGQITVWTSNTISDSNSLPPQLQLHDNGNLILTKSNDNKIIWQSFDYPTDTLLPHQLLTESASLVSSRSSTNHSSGFYKLFFDNDNVLRLMYKGPEITSVFWPDPWLNSWQGGRSTYNNSKVAMLDSYGSFLSSDELKFNTSDYSGGSGIPIQRRLTLDVDGNLRIHSLNTASKTWEVSWQAVANPCNIHGICGGNSLCTYSSYTGRKCTCLPGYKLKNLTDWTDGCVPDFQHSCSGGKASVFLQLPHVEFYGFDIGFYQNYTLEKCESLCLDYCDCKGFQYKFDQGSGSYNCYPKTIMFNGYNSLGFKYPVYIRLPKDSSISLEKNPHDHQDFSLQCRGLPVTPLEVGSYGRKHQHGSLKSFFWSTCAVGIFEIICLLAYFITTRMQSNSSSIQSYHLQVATGFRKFTYSELKKATGNFSKEIGRGGGGIVYRGVLKDNRVAAIKCLKEASQGEAEFLAEVSIIGRLNHMNLIEIWGYCAEGKHRLLVYEYMEHGSLRNNLQESSNLDWKKRYEIALGTARGLAYLHEECLEWVLHCDVKPENILLSDSYQPKVADFGLSKLLIRNGGIGSSNQDFSRIRGTRGYMAPEWVFNLPITSKVDVYSYGIVVLEMVTGRSPSGGAMEQRGLVNWVRENWHNRAIDNTKLSQIQHLLDPAMNVSDECDVQKMATLIEVAMHCSEEDKDSRPTMSQVVDMLQLHDIL